MPDSGALDETYTTLPLSDVKLSSGETLKDAEIAYKLIGSSDGPVIVYPTWFSGLISDNFYWLTSNPPAVDSSTHRILIPALFGNSQSTSPSNSSQRPFPAITLADNVHAQRRLLNHLGIDKIFAVIGWSMGGMTSLQWAMSYPDLFSSPASGVVAVCATSKCSAHNAVFLEGVKSALIGPSGVSSKGPGAPQHVDLDKEKKEVALKAMGRVYAGWGFSQPFYQKEGYKSLGFKTLDDWLVGFWEKWALSKEPENLLAMIQTWQSADIAAGANLAHTLNNVKVRSLLLPGELDLYFHRDDAKFDAAHIPKGECLVIPGDYGHWAGGPGGSEDDVQFIRSKIREFLGLAREDELKIAGGREKQVEVERRMVDVRDREGQRAPVLGGTAPGDITPGQAESEGPIAS